MLTGLTLMELMYLLLELEVSLLAVGEVSFQDSVDGEDLYPTLSVDAGQEEASEDVVGDHLRHLCLHKLVVILFKLLSFLLFVCISGC
jgi:hypothetical protein